MTIVDAALPAAVHLTGDGAHAVLAAAVERAGGDLRASESTQVHYRPDRELVVRYRCTVDWPGRPGARDTLFAAATATPLPGTLPVEADTPEGRLESSVWRWPFDPGLPGLEPAVTPTTCGDLLVAMGLGQVSEVPTLEVVAHRPTERSVVRARTEDGVTIYLKVLRPADVASIVDRHRRLGAAGLPVPAVLGVDETLGVVAMEERPGPTWRDGIKGDGPWPETVDVVDVVRRLASVSGTGLATAADRRVDAAGHAALLRVIVPELGARLDAIVDAVAPSAAVFEDLPAVVAHGDLHEAQIVVDDDGRITGLLDLDDVGPSWPGADLATLVGHLRFRAVVSPDACVARRLRRRADDLLRRSVSLGVPTAAVERGVAAVLVGLATGPFRVQRPDWRAETAATVAEAESMLARHMSEFSDRPHDQFRTDPHRG